MRFVVVSGSHRKNSNSVKVSGYLKDRLEKRPDHHVSLLELATTQLPFWDEAAWDKSSALAKQWQQIAEPISAADGIIIVAPEWGGMVPAILKNFFLFTGPAELGNKPGLICTVSSGGGGTHPIPELRISSYKNNKLCYLPEHLIVSHADSFPDGEVHQRLLPRIDYALDLLVAYAEGLAHVRSSPVGCRTDFPFGM